MVGQGSPRTSRGQRAPTASATVARCGWRFALLLCFALAPRGLPAAEMQVRLAWGGGEERLWSGTISLGGEAASRGSFRWVSRPTNRDRCGSRGGS